MQTKEVDKEENHLLIERDRIITVNVKRIIIENETKRIEVVKKQHRALAAFAKSCNKWFVIEEKQMWSADMNSVDLKKYRCSVRMITEGSVEDHEDVDLNTSHFELKSVARIASGVDVSCVHNCLLTC